MGKSGTSGKGEAAKQDLKAGLVARAPKAIDASYGLPKGPSVNANATRSGTAKTPKTLNR